MVRAILIGALVAVSLSGCRSYRAAANTPASAGDAGMTNERASTDAGQYEVRDSGVPTPDAGGGDRGLPRLDAGVRDGGIPPTPQVDWADAGRPAMPPAGTCAGVSTACS